LHSLQANKEEMNIDLHILCYNESDIIRFVLRHYKKFCRHLFVYDNHSTDNSREIAEEEGAIVHLFGSKFFDDQINMDTKNSCWKGSDADFVIVCDMDEVLAMPGQNIWQLIARARFEGVTIFKTYGWQVMSDQMPKDDLSEITNGYHFSNYSKSIVFNPKEIKEINYNLGAHRCNPVGNVVWSEEELYVLHYKHIGGLQRTIDRYNEYKPRMSPFNRKGGHGKHYNRSVASLKQEWEERMAKSKPLI
jgi:glycosyltransferase involved in cell wall biosynthesis